METKKTKKEVKISFKLDQIERLKYFENDPKDIGWTKNSELKTGFTIQTEFLIDHKNKAINITLDISCSLKEDDQKDLFGIKTRFGFKIKEFEKLLTKQDDSIVELPDGLVLVLVSISYSTVRGMLEELKSNPEYKKIFLPVIDPKSLVDKNKFKKKESTT